MIESKFQEVQPDQEYYCPSDGRTYRITNVRHGKQSSVEGICLDCISKKGHLLMSIEEFNRQLGFRTFILKEKVIVAVAETPKEEKKEVKSSVKTKKKTSSTLF